MTCKVIAMGGFGAEHPLMRTLLILVLAAFTVLTGLAVSAHGLSGIFEPLLANAAGLQVLVDLMIALALFLAWMWRDARRLNRNPWPWLALTLAAGSFGPLLYLITRRAELDGRA
jgi:Terpene cyclase DEP1